MTITNPLPITFYVDRVDVRAQKILKDRCDEVIAASRTNKNFPYVPVAHGLWLRTRIAEAMGDLGPHVKVRAEAVESSRSGDNDVAYASGVMAGLEWARTLIDQVTQP